MKFETLLRAGAVTAAAASLVACASAGPRYDIRGDTHKPRSVPQTAKRGGTWKPYQVNGKWYVPSEQPDYNEVGTASWYGGQHQGRPTANGERFDVARITAAHKTLPLPSIVEVTNLENGKRLRVRVNDRGPFVDGRIIDLSQEAARRLGFEKNGVAKVRVRYLGQAGIETAVLQVNIE